MSGRSDIFKIDDKSARDDATKSAREELSRDFGVDAIRFKLERQVDAIRDPVKFIKAKSTNLQAIMDDVAQKYADRISQLISVGHSFETANRTATKIAKEEFETAREIHEQNYPMELYNQALSKSALKTKAGQPGLQGGGL